MPGHEECQAVHPTFEHPAAGILTNINIGNVLMRFDVVNREPGSRPIHRRFQRPSVHIRRSVRRTPRSRGTLIAILGNGSARLFRINQRVFDPECTAALRYQGNL